MLCKQKAIGARLGLAEPFGSHDETGVKSHSSGLCGDIGVECELHKVPSHTGIISLCP